MIDEPNKKYYCLYILIIALLIAGVMSIILGQDANWDLKNYHIYNAWAFLHERIESDNFAAGMQTYFAPLLDVPYFLLAMRLLQEKPRAVAFIMGLPYGVILFVVFVMGWMTAEQYYKTLIQKIILSLLATAFGVSGVANISQIGTTFNEIQVSAITLTGILCILLAVDRITFKKTRDGWVLIAAAGLFCGIATGLKLTACIYTGWRHCGNGNQW